MSNGGNRRFSPSPRRSHATAAHVNHFDFFQIADNVSGCFAAPQSSSHLK